MGARAAVIASYAKTVYEAMPKGLIPLGTIY
jgi:hypothetical protein